MDGETPLTPGATWILASTRSQQRLPSGWFRSHSKTKFALILPSATLEPADIAMELLGFLLEVAK